MPSEDLFKERTGQAEVGPKSDVAIPSDASKLVLWIQKEKKLAESHVLRWRENAKLAYRFRDGKQLSEEDFKILTTAHRPTNAFNTTQKFIRFVTGIERYAPEALIFEPIDESNRDLQMLGEFVTRGYEWAMAKGSGHYERSQAFEDLLVTGMGWANYYLDYRRDFKGLPETVRLKGSEMWWPETERQNLEGTRWRAIETLIDKEEALERWPDETLLIDASIVDSGIETRPEVEGRVEYTVPYIETKPIEKQDTTDPKKNKINVLEWQWYDDEQGYYFFDPLERNDTWLPKKDFNTYQSRLKLIANQTIRDSVKKSKRVYKKVFLLNSKHQLGEILTLGDRFTLNCMTGTYHDHEKFFYGFEHVLIDPQKYANKFFNQVLEIIGTSAKGGGLYETGAVKANQVDQFEEDYAKVGSWNEVAPGAISGNKIMQKPLPQLPQASAFMMEFCTKAQQNVSGIDPETQFGQGAHNIPGITLRKKQQAGLVLLAKEFDSLSRFRLEEGRIVFDLLKLLADDRLIRVGGPFDGRVIKLMRSHYALDYELYLDDTEHDPNIRHMYSESIMNIAPTLIRFNKFIPELLDYFPLPVRIREKLKEAIVQQAQTEMQMAQQGIQRGGRGSPVSPQERQAKVQRLQADTQVQLARAERMKTQKRRDEVRTILEVLTQAHRAKLEAQKGRREAASTALDLIETAMGRTETKKSA